MSTITTAAREYAKRPADERFASLAALTQAATEDKARSREIVYNSKDLNFVPTIVGTGGNQIATRDDDPAKQEIQLESPKGRARMTHWSFGQVARDLQVPAAFLRDQIPAALAADVLNYRLSQTPHGDAMNLLVRAGSLDGIGALPGSTQPTIRAATGDKYGRVWDADLYSRIGAMFQADQAWQLPPTWEGGADGPRAGAYRGDRDSFLILTNGGSIVTDPSLTNGAVEGHRDGQDAGNMFRGIMVRNSEVGAASVVIETILYRYICGNHMLWGAVYDQRFRRRHVGAATLRDTMQKIHEIARKWTTQSVAQDQTIIKGLIQYEIAHTREAVIDELRKIGATQEQATQAYALCEQREHVSPRSYWGAVQGLTRLSQEQANQDGRYLIDQIAAQVLSRGAKRVAV